MCRECDPIAHGIGYLIILGVVLGLVTTLLAAWLFLRPLFDE